MNNILTEEEATRPVTYGELTLILEQIFKTVADGKEKSDEAMMESISTITDAIIESIQDLEYRRARDVRFFINVLSQHGYYSKDVMYDCYNQWCDEFDKLNKKEKQNECKTNC